MPAPVAEDEILIEGLEIHGRHGWFAHERETGCRFSIDLVLRFDTTSAAASDRLRDTIDYGAVSTEVTQVLAGESVHLLERLADRICVRLFERFETSSVRLTLRKLEPQIAGAPRAVGVRVERRRAP